VNERRDLSRAESARARADKFPRQAARRRTNAPFCESAWRRNSDKGLIREEDAYETPAKSAAGLIKTNQPYEMSTILAANTR